jgi:hypothetical protein
MRLLPHVVIVAAFIAILFAALSARARPRPQRPPLFAAVPTLQPAPQVEPEEEFVPNDPPPPKFVKAPLPPRIIAQAPKAENWFENFHMELVPEGHPWGANCYSCHSSQD